MSDLYLQIGKVAVARMGFKSRLPKSTLRAWGWSFAGALADIAEEEGITKTFTIEEGVDFVLTATKEEENQ
jgi:hypothetical protein